MRSRLGIKVLLALAVGLIAVMGTISYRGHLAFRQALTETNTRSAERMGDVIKRATRHSMLQNKREDVYFTIRSIGMQTGLKRIRIYNSEGTISFSTEENEIGQMVDKKAEACTACHSQSSPLERLNRTDRVRQFTDQSGTPVLAVINPIENEADCSSRACHYHPPSQSVLGTLDVQLSMAAADAEARSYLRQEIWRDIGGGVLLLGLTGVLVLVLVHRPIQPLMKATRRFATGDLSYRIPVRTSDELGRLAESFNRMGTELQAAREEVARWTQTLEARVEEQTAQVQQAVERLAEMDRLASLGKLAAAVAHEINNPLAGVLTYAKLLSRAVQRRAAATVGVGQAYTPVSPPGAAAGADAGPTPIHTDDVDEQREWLQVIESEIMRCGSLVKNLLMFARQMPMQVKECDVNAILNRCVRLVQHKLELQNIELEWKPEGELAVMCDASGIQQALLAIVINAIEVMPRGGFLRLKAIGDARAPAGPAAASVAGAEAAPQAGPAGVLIRITDSGPGIPANVLPHIFEPFFTTKEEVKSIGMGLSVAYGIMEQHGGRISVESQVGQGTSFVTWVPYQAGGEGRVASE